MSEIRTNTRKERPGIFWPLALIAVGVIFLLNNLNIAHVSGWGFLATYWPLIFVIGSLDDIYRGKDLPGAVIGVGFAAMMVAGNLGYLPLDALQILIRFWPVVFVSIGLNLLFANHTLLMNIIGVVLALLVVAGLLFMGLGSFNLQPAATSPLEVALDGASEGQINIELPVGPIKLSGGDLQTELLKGSYVQTRNLQLDQTYAVKNGTGTLELSSSSDHFTSIPGLSQLPRLDAKINQSIPVSLSAKLGAGEMDVNLSATHVQDVNVEIGAGSIYLTVDKDARLKGNLSLATGAMTLKIPQGVDVYIDGDLAVTLVSLPAGWSRTEGVIVSPGAEKGTAQVYLEINQPVGIINIQSIP